MSQEVDRLRAEMFEGRRVPSEHAQEFTLTVGPASRPPQEGDIWILAGAPYIISEVKGRRPKASGTLRYLAEAWPPPRAKDQAENTEKGESADAIDTGDLT